MNDYSIDFKLKIVKMILMIFIVIPAIINADGIIEWINELKNKKWYLKSMKATTVAFILSKVRVRNDSDW